LRRRLLEIGTIDEEREVEIWKGVGADELRVAVHEGAEFFLRGRLSGEVGDIDRKEVAAGEEGLDGLEADVVGIHEVGLGPAEGAHGSVRLLAEARGLGADEGVFAVGFVPDGMDGNALEGGVVDGGELGDTLAAEAVAGAKGEAGQGFHRWCGVEPSGFKDRGRGRVWLQ
jgi:hypothetical protein